MKRISETIQVGEIKERFVLNQFESIAAAVRYLGEEKALQFINYAFALAQRSQKRQQIIADPKNRK